MNKYDKELPKLGCLPIVCLFLFAMAVLALNAAYESIEHIDRHTMMTIDVVAIVVLAYYIRRIP